MSNINQDIQASHKILSLLEGANSHSEHIIDSLPGVFLVINEKFRILRGNVESANAFGLEHESLLGTNFQDLFNEHVCSLFKHQFKQLEQDESRVSVKFELDINTTSSGKKEKAFYWQLTKMPSGNNAEGKLYSLLGKDISELRVAEDKLSNIFANIPLGILTLDDNGNIEDTYSSYLHCLLGVNDFNGKSFRNLLMEAAHEHLTRDELHGIDNIYECLNKDQFHFEELAPSFPEQLALNNEDPTDQRYIQLSYKPLVYEGLTKRLLIIIEDKTAFIAAEKEQERVMLIEKQSRAIYESAIRDPLTGLYTRLYMEDGVESMLNSHNRHNINSTSLVMFDIDHFKRVNDTYGHDVGDRALKAIADIILRQVRGTDVPVRFGGEEFMVFLPANDHCCALLSERVRHDVESLNFMVEGKHVPLTISGGVVSHRTDESLKQLIKRADQLLYKAKKAGRNRIEVEETM
jgi:diguanylate cyclase (GGDEF)-like protein/PAS domain S-box-containing protein